MRKIIFIFVIASFLYSCVNSDKNNFTLRGKLDGMRKGTVFLKKNINGAFVVIDSINLKGTDVFEFKGYIESPEVFLIATSKKNTYDIPVFLEQKVITLNSKMNDLLLAEINGSENQELLDQFNEIMKGFNVKKNELFVNRFNIKDTASNEYKRMVEKSEHNELRRAKYIINFALSNASKDISPYIALNYLLYSDISVLDTIDKSMTEEVKSGKYGREFHKFVTQTKATSTGNKLPKIVMKDTSNLDVILENKKGFLLLNFWITYDEASRSYNKSLKKLHSKFDGDELKIISISLDSNKSDWINVVNKDSIPWLQLSDYDNNNIATQTLAIKEVPENILLDKENNILGRNLTTDEIMIFMMKIK